MDKDAWRHTWGTLLATCQRLEAEISKHQEGPLLKGVLEADSQQVHRNVFKCVTDARKQLVDLQQLVSGEGQTDAAFLAALSDRITTFTQQLNTIKQQQRSDYAVLLREEQQLLEELAVLELSLAEEHVQDTQSAQPAWPGPADAGCFHASPAQQQRRVSTAWEPSCSSSRLSTAQDSFLQASSSRRASDAAADCVCKSPDRPSGQAGSNSSSPVKGPCAGASSSSLPPEVQAYDAFLARHGATGGWHPDDHKTFMAILKAHRGDNNAALAATVDALPLQTRQSVIAHCRWHADLCELEMRKRIALVNWRTAKEAAKAAFRAQAVALGDTSGLFASFSLATAPSAPADQQQKEVRQLKQQLVQQWKQEQAAAREEAVRAAQELRRLQQQQEREQRQQRQEELKRQLQAAEAAKEREQPQAAAAAAKQASLSQLALDPEQKQRLQQRNSATLERQRQLLAAKQAKLEAKERAQQQLLAAAQGMRPQVDRDPSRLLSATTAAAARAAAAAADAAEAKEAAAQSSRGRSAGGFVLQLFLMARTRRLLFVSVPMHGHINPLLEPARLLVKQGQDVLFVCYEQHRGAVENANIPFKSLGPDCIDRKQQSQIDPYATKKAKMLASAALFTGWEEDMYHPLLQTCRAFQPDVIVADMTTLAAHDVAESLKLPLALLGSMPLSLALDLTGYSTFNSASDVPFEDPGVLVLPEHMSLLEKHVINPLYKKIFGEGSVMHLPMLRARDALREQFGLPDMPLGAGPLQVSRRIPRSITILATSWLMEAKRDLPRGWHLVGAMGCDFTHNFPPPLPSGPIRQFLELAQAAGRPVMLVATGTTTVLPDSSVQAMAAAFASLPDISFLWSLKQESQEHLPEGYKASNVMVTSWVPQTAVLGHPAVKGFLCHGGHTTTNEALATGTPMLCMPFGGDQLVVAQHIKDHGYGLQIGLINHTPDAIATKIQKLLSKPEYAAKAASAAQKVRSVCGPALTAWLLADFARPPPEVETDSADSTDETEELVGVKKLKQKTKKEKIKSDSEEKSWWPRFDRRTKSADDLARSAVAAH